MSRPSPGGRVVEQDDVPGLLAAEHELARRASPPARTGRRPAVSTTSMPASAIAWRKPRLAMTVATTVSPASRPVSRSASASMARIWSPSTTSPRASTARQRSASPSCAMPASAPCAATAAGQRVQVGGPAAVVDVQPVRLGADRDHLGAGPAQQPRAPAGRGPVRAVDDHPQPGQRRPAVPGRHGREQVVEVAPDLRAAVADPAEPVAGHPPRAGQVRTVRETGQGASIASSTASGSLTPPRAKNLIPLSGAGLWLADSMTPRSAPRSAVR